MENLTDAMIDDVMGTPETIQDEMLEVTDSEKCLDYTIGDIKKLLKSYILEDKEREMWEHALNYIINVERKKLLIGG